MNIRNIFRRQTLDQLDNPGQIPDFVRVTHPPLYLVLSAMFLCCLVVSLWVVFGTVTEHVKTIAIVFPQTKMFRQTLTKPGVVDELLVESGQSVKVGQPMMLVRNGALIDTVYAAKAGLIMEMKNVDDTFRPYEPLLYLIPSSRHNLGTDLVAFVKYQDLRTLSSGQEAQVTPSDLHREDYGYITGRITHVSSYPISKIEAKHTYWLHNFVDNLFPGNTAYKIIIKLDTEKFRNGQRLKWSRNKSKKITLTPLSFCNVQIITERKPVYRMIFRY